MGCKISILAVVIALSTLASQVCFSADVLSEYRTGHFEGLIPKIEKKISESEIADVAGLVRTAEDVAVLRLHRLDGLAGVYRAALKKTLPSMQAFRYQERLNQVTLNSHVARTSAADEITTALKLHKQGQGLLVGLPPYPKAEGFFLVSSAFLLEALTHSPADAQKSDALFALTESLVHLFPGKEISYLEEFVRSFPKDKRAREAFDDLKEKIADSYRVQGHTSELPEREMALLKELEAKIPLVKKTR